MIAEARRGVRALRKTRRRGWGCGLHRRLGEAAQDELQLADVVLDGEAPRLLGVDAQVDDDGLGAQALARAGRSGGMLVIVGGMVRNSVVAY
jgi:hypothetical protein